MRLQTLTKALGIVAAATLATAGLAGCGGGGSSGGGSATSGTVNWWGVDADRHRDRQGLHLGFNKQHPQVKSS